VLTLEYADSARREAMLAWPSGAVFTCPAQRARLVAVVTMGRLDAPAPVAIVSFGADTASGGQDLLAFVDAKARLLALEPASWRSDGTLETRAALLPDRLHIALERNAAIHDRVWRREAWTDYLRLDSGRLVNAPQRMILPGSWQNALIARRAALAALLSPPPVGVPAEALKQARAETSPFTPAT